MHTFVGYRMYCSNIHSFLYECYPCASEGRKDVNIICLQPSATLSYYNGSNLQLSGTVVSQHIVSAFHMYKE